MADQALVQFSLVGLHKAYRDQIRLQDSQAGTTLSDVEDALLYLSKIGAMRLEGGFLVLYNGLEIKRLILDNKIRYKQDVALRTSCENLAHNLQKRKSV